ncbi:nuclear transport factor 2 family protein [Streptomyces rectiverticillatus]|uniref:nuclear transport factor 2 family protein n=1 Tax=Streptomyces rectiverticillatus TaxID=173860 RepID=UPI0015C2EE3E|nr:nuclear transport factor 2 family protein [Streptomyces rectiverticillatus]QLE70930.1 nuclear transport factor 2 family protein [Streptomyces rectiverticillatus]
MNHTTDLAETVKHLTERVRELEAVRELTRLRSEFHRCLNNAEWDGLGALFTDDAHLDYGDFGQAHGSAGIRDFYSALPAKILEFKRGATRISFKNFIHGHQVEVRSEDTATGVSFFEEKIRFDRESEIHNSIGQFTDAYVHRDGRWYFAKVELDHYWVVPDNEGWRWPW